MAASSLESPAPSLRIIASTVVIASSTSSASAMISAPSEMRCSPVCVTSITAKTIASVSGMASATTAPGRTPRLRKLQTRMITIACHSDVMKSPIATSTETAWSATSTGSIPSGRSARMSAIRLRTFFPRARMSPASRIAMARPIAGLPFTRNIGCGGSTKPRRTVAMSPSRKMRSPEMKLTFSMSRSVSNAPVTRRKTRSCAVWMTPAGRTRFCACSVAMMVG